jgi:hypothetical protein
MRNWLCPRLFSAAAELQGTDSSVLGSKCDYYLYETYVVVAIFIRNKNYNYSAC